MGASCPIQLPEMKGRSSTPQNDLPAALDAIVNLTVQELNNIFRIGDMAAHSAHAEIRVAQIHQRTGPFYRYLVPLRRNLVSLLAENYRRYFKVALAHRRQIGNDLGKWSQSHLQPAVMAALEWLRDWYILTCDGENQYVRRIGSIPYVAGQTVSLAIPTTVSPGPPPTAWRAPSWLFEVSLALVGIGTLKTKHVPARDSEERLGAAHTRLLLKGARRIFLWELQGSIETVRNEEAAAAGAIPAAPVNERIRRPNKRQGWEQREKLYHAIRDVLGRDSSLQGIALCAELDKRHAPPLFDWTKNGGWPEGLTWKEAWRQSGLRRKIRRVRQEALKKTR
jgi:hypothetical protein